MNKITNEHNFQKKKTTSDENCQSLVKLKHNLWSTIVACINQRKTWTFNQRLKMFAIFPRSP